MIIVLGIVVTSSILIYLIICSHKKYRIKKERELSFLIAKYQQELDELESKHSASEEESEKLSLLIKQKEDQIEQLRQKKEASNLPEIQSAIIEGLELYVTLEKSVHSDKLLRIEVSQFKSFIAYYDKLKPEFVQALKKCGLTDYEIVICLLFSISFSHKQVCEVLRRSSETLSRVKLRLKDKIKKGSDKEGLVQISSFVDLNL